MKTKVLSLFFIAFSTFSLFQYELFLQVGSLEDVLRKMEVVGLFTARIIYLYVVSSTFVKRSLM